jgi:YndJ-like protein
MRNMKTAKPTPTKIITEQTATSHGFFYGAAIWSAIAIASYFNWFRLDLVELLFLLAPWAIVPSALTLTPALEKSYPIGIFRSQRWLFFVAAAPCTISFLYPVGITAAILCVYWLLICLCIAWGGINRLFTFRAESFPQFCVAVAECYIAVGGIWLVMSRAGLHPAGFQEPIVLLTAVHFHFAGFLSSIFAGLTYDQLQTTKWAKPRRIILLGTLLGPGLLGISFLISPKLKLIAVILIVIGQCGLAAGMARISTTIARGASSVLLMLAAASVAIAMIYAAKWALGEYPLQPMTDLSHMERIHGVLNSIGFSAIGLVGWLKFRTKNLHST